jgi:PilZ domain
MHSTKSRPLAVTIYSLLLGLEDMDTAQKMIRRTPDSEKPISQRPRAERWMRPGALIIEVAGGGSFPKPISVQFHDGSVSGIGFMSRQPLVPPTRFSVVVRHPKRGNLVINYEVVRCQQLKRNMYEIGAKLLR